MKATKQLTSSIITAALALLLATPAMATDNTTTITGPGKDSAPVSGNTQITAGVNQSYTLVIPETMTFENLSISSEDAARTQSFDVTANGVVLAPGKALEVRVQGDNEAGAFQLPNTADDNLRLPYSVYSGDSALTSGNIFAAFETSTEAQTQSGKIVVDQPTMGAGTYQGNLTFVCNVVQQAGTKE